MESKPVNTPRRHRPSDVPSARPSLDREHWIDAATDLLAEQGVAGLRIEVLAKACNVTKGSFYWHFRDRQDLLQEVLGRWKEGRIRDIDKTTAVQTGAEKEQLRYAIDIYGTSRNRRGMQIELAVRDWARHDAQAAAVVEEIDLYRLECTRKLFVAGGMSEVEARSRSLLLYACVFGLSLMRYEKFDADLGELKNRIADRIIGP